MTPAAAVDLQFGVLAAGLDWSIAQLVIVGLVGLGALYKNWRKPAEKTQESDTPASKAAAKPPAATMPVKARPVPPQQPARVRAEFAPTIPALLAPIRKALPKLVFVEESPAPRPPHTPEIPVARAGRRKKVRPAREVQPSVATPLQPGPTPRHEPAGLRGMLRTQAGLRRAIVLNEILNPPLALRDDHLER